MRPSTPLFATATFALALALAGCGGRSVEIGDSDAGPDGAALPDGAPAPDARGQCTPLPGCSSSTTCPAGDGCNTCSCFDGEWACTLLGCPTPTCPVDPTPGGACTSNGQRCSGSGRCPLQCTCESGAWKCIAPPCAPPPPCPSQPVPGSDCTAWRGETCTQEITPCGAAQCFCADTPSPTWACAVPDCPPPPSWDAGAP